MKRRFVALAALAAVSSPALALQQTAPAAGPEAASAPSVTPAVAAAPVADVSVLPANSEVIVALNEALSSDDKRLGDTFSLTVSQDVKANGAVVIPKGTRAVGQITYRKGKGGFGKSGKIDLDFRYIDYEGRHIPLEGHYHQEGNGNGAAAVGAVLAAGVIGGLIVHGHSARIPQGHEFVVHLVDAIPLGAPTTAGSPALIAASYTPTPVNTHVMTPKERKAAEKAAGEAAKRAREAGVH
ncbi:MAG: hypothetical protein QOH81_947 [Sphingomonadales bacterium]|jgi:hypothetical protein|nr:hypothetical protein [Sphingomonadales bacterium]